MSAFGDNVIVRANVSYDGQRLSGMRGIVVDTPGEEPDPDFDLEYRFVRFPATHTRREFFSWVRDRDLELLEATEKAA